MMLTNLFAEYFAIFCLLKSASQLGLSRLTAQIHISNMLFKYYFTVWKLWNFTLTRKNFVKTGQFSCSKCVDFTKLLQYKKFVRENFRNFHTVYFAYTFLL